MTHPSTSTPPSSFGAAGSPPSISDLLLMWKSRAMIVGAAGTILALVGAVAAPEYFYPSYLVAFLFWLAPTMGCWVMTMIHWLSGGMWGQVIRRVLMATLPTMPFLLFAFFPILLPGLPGVQHIYPWAQVQGQGHGEHGSTESAAAAEPAKSDEIKPEAAKPEAAEASPSLAPVIEAWKTNIPPDHEMANKLPYLDVDAWRMRAGAIFILWIVLTWILERWAWGDSPREESIHRHWGYRLAGPSLLIFSLSVLVSSTDWSMSIQPHWYSAMYGVATMGIYAITGLAFAIMASSYLSEWDPWKQLDMPRHWGDLGSLLFTATMFWTYTAFMQYLIIYAGNLPIEGSWFVARNNHGYEWVSRMLVAFHFFVPFMCLLMRPIKRDRKLLAYVAGLLIFMELVEYYWVVIPALFPEEFTLHWTLPVAVVAIGGWWVAIVSSRLHAQLARPIYDPEYEKAIHAAIQDHADLSVAG